MYLLIYKSVSDIELENNGLYICNLLDLGGNLKFSPAKDYRLVLI